MTSPPTRAARVFGRAGSSRRATWAMAGFAGVALFLVADGVVAVVRDGTVARAWRPWAVAVVAAVGVAEANDRRSLRRHRERWAAGTCPKCGYDLRGSPSQRCPECGTNWKPF